MYYGEWFKLYCTSMLVVTVAFPQTFNSNNYYVMLLNVYIGCHVTSHTMYIHTVMHTYIDTYRTSEIIQQNNSLIIKFQGKMFSWIHDFLEIFLP